MADPREFDQELVAEIDSVDEAWQRELATRETLIQAEAIGGLLVYELKLYDELSVTFAGLDEDPAQTRRLKSHLMHQRTGLLEVDSDSDEVLQGETINLGSFANHAGSIQFISPGLLRGFLMLGGGVAIDPTGHHFIGGNTLYLPAEYKEISVNGISFGQPPETNI